MITTRRSCAIARNILRRFSACVMLLAAPWLRRLTGNLTQLRHAFDQQRDFRPESLR